MDLVKKEENALSAKFKGRHKRALSGREMLDCMVGIADKLEESFPEHIAKVGWLNGYLSDIIQSYVPWATYETCMGDMHNPFFGTSWGRIIKKKDLKFMEPHWKYDDKRGYGSIPPDAEMIVCPIIINTTLLESEKYFERSFLESTVNHYSGGVFPDFVVQEMAKFWEYNLRRKGYREFREEQNESTLILLENKVNLGEGVRLHGNFGGWDEDLFMYRDRYFFKSVYDQKNMSKDMFEVASKYPNLQKYCDDCISLFFGGVVFDANIGGLDLKTYECKDMKPYAHIIYKHSDKKFLPMGVMTPELE